MINKEKTNKYNFTPATIKDSWLKIYDACLYNEKYNKIKSMQEESTIANTYQFRKSKFLYGLS